MQTSATAEFSQRYQGKIRINTAVLSKAASRSTLIAQQVPNTGPMTFTHTQAASETSGKFDNLFYGFENGNLASGSRVLLTLKGTYDRDGNFATESDQAEVTYEIELSGGGSGQILRNGYYRIQVGLDGLTGKRRFGQRIGRRLGNTPYAKRKSRSVACRCSGVTGRTDPPACNASARHSLFHLFCKNSL